MASRSWTPVSTSQFRAPCQRRSDARRDGGRNFRRSAFEKATTSKRRTRWRRLSAVAGKTTRCSGDQGKQDFFHGVGRCSFQRNGFGGQVPGIRAALDSTGIDHARDAGMDAERSAICSMSGSFSCRHSSHSRDRSKSIETRSRGSSTAPGQRWRQIQTSWSERVELGQPAKSSVSRRRLRNFPEVEARCELARLVAVSLNSPAAESIASTSRNRLLRCRVSEWLAGCWTAYWNHPRWPIRTGWQMPAAQWS